MLAVLLVLRTYLRRLETLLHLRDRAAKLVVFTTRAILDVIGNGESGTLIRGDQIARTLRESSQRLFLTAANPPVLKNKQALTEYLENLEKLDLPLDTTAARK